MSRSKNKTQKKDNETKEQKIERLRKQAESREACFKLLPYAGGILFLCLLIFGIYVRSIPPKAARAARAPKAPKAPIDPDAPLTDEEQAQFLQEAMNGESMRQMIDKAMKEAYGDDKEEGTAAAPDLADMTTTTEETTTTEPEINSEDRVEL